MNFTYKINYLLGVFALLTSVLFTSCQEEELVVPANVPVIIPVTIAELNTGNYEGRIVQIEGVSFSEPVGTKFNGTSSNGGGNKTLVDCNGNSTTVFTPSDKPFSDQELPIGNGTIIGKASSFNGTIQLLPRTEADFAGLQNGGGVDLSGNVTIAQLRNIYQCANTQVKGAFNITGVVTISPEQGNLNSRNVFIQDAAGTGIALRFKADHSLKLGEQVTINCQGLALEKFNGLLQLNEIDEATNIISKGAATLPTPVTATIADIKAGKYEGQLVKIEGVEFKGTGAVSGTVEITTTDCAQSLPVYTRSDANFSNTNRPDGTGSIVGVVTVATTPQLIIRDMNDISFTGAKVCNAQ
ncbi:DUF5689 domain-containing protein [uncultured Microscilla sp.]|uniref:DUF5689 domain-containing protein n=1 Tax=uncultured Microscilla sp. TaxID=432653 RepID=UPI0026337605|nr:DUF5689 domain-containing protein [uncultured Microscilla sp.]